MKVYFTHSSRNIEQFERFYEITASSVKDSGYDLIYHPKDLMIRDNKASIKLSDYYTEMMKSIISSDVCIFDTSSQSMRVGHQLTYALENSTPVLVLAHVSAGDIENFFIGGSRSGYLKIYAYESKYQLKEIIPKFLKSCTVSKVRLNLSLEKYDSDYIKAKAYQHKITQTEVVKKALESLREKDRMES